MPIPYPVGSLVRHQSRKDFPPSDHEDPSLYQPTYRKTDLKTSSLEAEEYGSGKIVSNYQIQNPSRRCSNSLSGKGGITATMIKNLIKRGLFNSKHEANC